MLNGEIITVYAALYMLVLTLLMAFLRPLSRCSLDFLILFMIQAEYTVDSKNFAIVDSIISMKKKVLKGPKQCESLMLSKKTFIETPKSGCIRIIISYYAQAQPRPSTTAIVKPLAL